MHVPSLKGMDMCLVNTCHSSLQQNYDSFCQIFMTYSISIKRESGKKLAQDFSPPILPEEIQEQL